MMVASAVAQWLHDQGIGVYNPAGVGGDIFVDTLPTSPGDAVAVMSTGGTGVGGGIEWGWSTPTVQLLARGDADPRTSAGRLQRALDAVATLAGFTLIDQAGTLRIAGARPVQGEPVRIGPDDNGRHRHSVNLALDVERAQAG